MIISNILFQINIQSKLIKIEIRENSVQLSRSVVSNSLRPHELQHTRPPCSSPTPEVNSDLRPWSQ